MAVRKKKASSEKDELVAKLAAKLGISEAEVEARAMRELAASVGVSIGEGVEARAAPPKAPEPATPATSSASPAAVAKPSAPPPAAATPSAPPPARGLGGLPQRLFLSLDGRGLPIEVIDLPTSIGSGRMNTIWVNSPQIETRHLQITHSDEGYLLEDLGTEHGTYLGTERITRHILANGDELRLAGYLRMTVELR